jgi:hypothetical protein
VAGIVRKYRINHEEAQKPERKYGGQSAGGAELLFVHILKNPFGVLDESLATALAGAALLRRKSNGGV